MQGGYHKTANSEGKLINEKKEKEEWSWQEICVKEFFGSLLASLFLDGATVGMTAYNMTGTLSLFRHKDKSRLVSLVVLKLLKRSFFLDENNVCCSCVSGKILILTAINCFQGLKKTEFWWGEIYFCKEKSQICFKF